MLHNRKQSERVPYIQLKDLDKKSHNLSPTSFLYRQSQPPVSQSTKSVTKSSEDPRKKLKDELVRCLPSQKIFDDLKKDNKSTEFALEQESRRIRQSLSNHPLPLCTAVLRDILFDG